MKKNLFVSLLFFSAAVFPSATHAQTPFGGLDVFTMPCTCGFAYNYHVFAPLYLSSVPITGAFAALVTPTIYSYHVLHPGAWALGSFTPGVQACWMWAGHFCYPLPTLGTISPFTGTSP